MNNKNLKQVQDTIYKIHEKLLSIQIQIRYIETNDNIENIVSELMEADELFNLCLYKLFKEKDLNSKKELTYVCNLETNLRKLMNFSHILIFAIDNHFGKLAYDEILYFLDYMINLCELLVLEQ